MYTYLNAIDTPEDLKKLSMDEQMVLAYEIRTFLLETLSKTGGHLASNLGVVELTLALHGVFDSPQDRLIWDVGHQAYVHKLLTGRRDGFEMLRQYDGMSGFPKRSESAHDVFDTGHSSTSLSAGLGFALTRDLSGDHYDVVSIIGDGALTGGMALEALNYLGHCKTNMKIILNDNAMSISENIGGVSEALSTLRLDKRYGKLKGVTKARLSEVPRIGNAMVRHISRFKSALKTFVVNGGVFFESLGITYIGPIDGHDLKSLYDHMRRIKDMKGPVVLHVLTQKGKGYRHAELAPGVYHGVGPFDPGRLIVPKPKRDYSAVFGNALCALAAEHDTVVAISAAMIDGTGLCAFSQQYPERTFDVAIAEQNAVTMGAAMSLNGFKPYIAIYSTFLQRAYDQIIHDVAIQRCPVVFCVDRAGPVGNDGETHHGLFDVSYLTAVPGMTLWAPASSVQLEAMIQAAYEHSAGPLAIRYPRGDAPALPAVYVAPDERGFLPQRLREGTEGMIVTFGAMTHIACEAADLVGEGRVGVLQILCLKPLHVEAIVRHLEGVAHVMTLEDTVLKGGFGASILELFHGRREVISWGVEDVFIPQGDTRTLLRSLGLDAQSVARRVEEVLDDN